MKKIFSIVAVAFIAAVWYALPVFAATVDMSGEYRVRGIYINNAGFGQDVNGTATGIQADQNWLDSRFRVDGVVKQGMTTGVIQLDYLGATQTFGNGVGDLPSTVLVRQAYLAVALPHYDLIAGRHGVKVGNGLVLDAPTDLVAVNFPAGPVNLMLAYITMGEDDNATNPPSTPADKNGILLNAAMKAAGWDWTGFLIQTHDTTISADNKLQTIGVTADGKVGSVKVMGEVDFFSGDATSTISYKGTNAVFGGTLPMGMFDLNGAIIYASGDKSATDSDLNVNTIAGDYAASNIMIGSYFTNGGGTGNLGTVSGSNLGLQALKASASFKPFTALGSTHAPEVGIVYMKTSEDDAQGDSDIGTEIYLNTNCTLDKSLSANIGVAYLAAGDALVGAGASADNVIQLDAALTFRF
jgi:hypothetical protein